MFRNLQYTWSNYIHLRIVHFVAFQEFRQSLHPHVLDKAEQWMKLAPNADRKVIEKVLRMAEKKQKLGGTLSKSLQPDAKDAVDKWLLGANEAGKLKYLFLLMSLKYSRILVGYIVSWCFFPPQSVMWLLDFSIHLLVKN